MDSKPLYVIGIGPVERKTCRSDRLREDRKLVETKVRTFKLGVKKEFLKREKIYE